MILIGLGQFQESPKVFLNPASKGPKGMNRRSLLIDRDNRLPFVVRWPIHRPVFRECGVGLRHLHQ